MTILELSDEQYLATFNSPMNNVTESASPVLDIWPYVHHLVDLNLVPEAVWKDNLVEAVYRDRSDSYDHILLPTAEKNQFVAFIIDVRRKEVLGYHLLNLENEYSLSKSAGPKSSMRKITLALLFYVIAYVMVLRIHKLSPTNMAGPGWDIVVYFVSAIVAVALLTTSLFKMKSGNKLSYINLLLNLVGTIAIIYSVYRQLTTS